MVRLLSLISFVFFSLYATAQNPNIIRIGQNTYTVGCYAQPFRFERIVQHNNAEESLQTPRKQLDDFKTPVTDNATGGIELYWDWAACLQMCLNYQGLNVSQEQVMTQANGSVESLIQSLNRTAPHDWSSKDAKIYTATAAMDADVLFDELSAGRPLVVGTRKQGEDGRAYVITAMAYTIQFDANGQQTGIAPVSVTVRDPWPTALANRTVTWQDFILISAAMYTVNVVFK